MKKYYFLFTAIVLYTSGSILSAQELNEKLLQAAKDGDTTLVKQLIEAGADVNTADSTGKTVLHKAV